MLLLVIALFAFNVVVC